MNIPRFALAVTGRAARGVAFASLAILVTAAAPAQEGSEVPASTDPSTGNDRVVLDVGTVLQGRIVQETDDYVEIEIAPGTVVGFERRRTVEIVRAARDDVATDDAGPAAVEPTESWHALVDAEGRSVGWLHGSRGPDADGRIRYAEEWHFVDGERTTEVSVVEVVEPDGKPVSCFAHERVRGNDGAFVGRESIVRARVDQGRLVVDRRQSDRSERQSYPAPDGLRFPLALRDELRRRPAGHHQRVTRLVFDPLLGDFVHRTFQVGRTRQVADASGSRRVRVVTAETRGGEQVEWVDSGARVLRREIQGAALVALPATEAQARRWAGKREQVAPIAFGASTDGRLALWLPNPGWSFVHENVAANQVIARSELDDAVFTLLSLEQFDATVPLATVTDAVLRWLRLVHDDLEGLERESVEVRGRPSERIRARYVDGTTVYALELHVLHGATGWFVASATAPRIRVAEVRRDFERILRRLELRAAAIDPPLTGPLAERR